MATVTDHSAFERWQAENTAAPQRNTPSTTVSGVPIDALYTPESLADFVPETDIGYPGQYPFMRGVHATMYRSRLWTMRQFAGFGTPRQTNERFRFLLDKGQTGLSTAFDLPTLMGLDSDRKSTRLNSSHRCISYAVFCLKKTVNHTSNVP